MRSLTTMLLFTLAITARPVEASSPHPPGLIASLGAYDQTPSLSLLQSLCADPVTCLENVAVDSGQGRYVRHRAVNLLSASQTEASMRTLERFTTHPERFIQSAAIYTLIRAFGPLKPNEVASWAERGLASPSAVTRAAAVRALRFIPGEPVERRIGRLATVETHRRVLAAIKSFKRSRR